MRARKGWEIEVLDIRHIRCPVCKGEGSYEGKFPAYHNETEIRVESCDWCEKQGWVHALFIDGEFVEFFERVTGRRTINAMEEERKREKQGAND